MASPFCLSCLFHLGSFSCASVAAFYIAYTFLSPTLSESVSGFGLLALCAPRAMPVLFLLLNLLVAALYVRSRMMLQAKRGHQEGAEINMNMNEGSNAAQLPKKTSDDGFAAGAFVCNAPSGSDVDKVGRLEIQKRSVMKKRLARSKSDGVLALAATGKSAVELRAIAPLLKKSRTFESGRRVKPVVVVADPPEDGQVADKEVDKKAEEFIGKFYQKVKLQRLESLKRAARHF